MANSEVSKVLQPCDIYWEAVERNVGRSIFDQLPPTPEEEFELVDSLSQGWNVDKTPDIKVSEPPKARLAELYKRRVAIYEDLQERASKGEDDAKKLLEAFQALYVKGGKVIAGSYVPNFGFQRGARLLKAWVRAVYPPVKGGRGSDKNDPVEASRPAPEFNIACKVVPYVEDKELYRVQIDENTQQGKRPVGIMSFLPLARQMYDEGRSESDFTRTFSEIKGNNQRHMGQTLHRLEACIRSPRYKESHLRSRIAEGVKELEKRWVNHYALSPKEQAKDEDWDVIPYVPGGKIDPHWFKNSKEMLIAFLKEAKDIPSTSVFRNEGYSHDAAGFEKLLEALSKGRKKKSDSTLMKAAALEAWTKNVIGPGAEKENLLYHDAANAIMFDDPDARGKLLSNETFNQLCNAIHFFHDRTPEECLKAIAAVNHVRKGLEAAETDPAEEEEEATPVAHGRKSRKARK